MTPEQLKYIKQASEIYADVIGTDDVFYVKITKAEAIRVVEQSQGQLEVTQIDRIAFIGARIQC
jgi:hypothetical protein